MIMLLPLIACFWLGAVAHANPVTDKYADLQAGMRSLIQAHPTTTQLVELGVSDSGRTIEGLKIGDGPVSNLIVATHHGNEYGSTEIARALAQSLAETPIDGQTVYVIPVLNISGFDLRQRGEATPTGSQDPNRDYPGPCGTDGPFKLKSTALLASFINEHQIVVVATLHTRHPAVLYPWGFATSEFNPPELDTFQRLARAATVESGYIIGNSTDVIYASPGTFEDYAFWRHGIWALLFELGNSHKPTEANMADWAKVNVPGLRRMLTQAPHERAQDHEFHGRCDSLFSITDLHDE